MEADQQQLIAVIELVLGVERKDLKRLLKLDLADRRWVSVVQCGQRNVSRTGGGDVCRCGAVIVGHYEAQQWKPDSQLGQALGRDHPRELGHEHQPGDHGEQEPQADRDSRPRQRSRTQPGSRDCRN